MVLKLRFGRNLRVLNEGKTGSLYLIFLVLHNICKFGFLPCLVFVILSPLLDRCEPRFVAFGKLAINIWSFDRLVLLSFALESRVHLFDFLSVFLMALCSQFGHGPCIRHNRTRRMLRIGLPHWQEVIIVKDNSTLLHYSKRT